MTSHEIRKRFLTFFEKRGHAIIPSASLVPENDPSVLFITAGMQPLVPYLTGTAHPLGQRIANVQKCVRTQDIEEVGDATHDTFFEMLGNWSIGDSEADNGVGEDGYFKKEAIEWSYEFLTSAEEGLGLDPERLYITIFEGNDDAPRDEESRKIWMSLGVPEHRIYEKGVDDNWWSPGDNGPCGPDTEMFYDVTEEGLGDLTPEEFDQADDDQKVIEIWNDVFMEYEKSEGRVVGKLAQKNVDTGAGLERLAMVLQKKDNVFDTDLFREVIAQARTLTSTEEAARIIADHIRTAVFMITDGIEPSNTEQGYILRRLLRRSVMKTERRTLERGEIETLVEAVIATYEGVYDELNDNKEHVIATIYGEIEKFASTLEQGVKEFEKIKGDISGEEAFNLYQTYGFPLEVTEELAIERGAKIDTEGFNKALKKHKEASKKGAEGKFKGGLADQSEMSVKYHTATHLLNEALHEILGDHVEQKGSNITPDRLRFDFTHPEKLTGVERQKVEDRVNEKIVENLPVQFEEMDFEEAKKRGARGVFGERYADRVKVYTIGDPDDLYSMEICGGPHVENTGVLGTFRITKEQSSSKGVRRIKATLE